MTELRMHHVGVVVSDLDEAVSFYRDTLGLPVADEFTLSGEGIGTAIDVDGVTGDFVHLDAGGGLVELVEYDPAGDDVAGDAVNQLGAKHVGFTVDDIDEFHETLPGDVDPVSGPQEIETGASIVFFRDPDGNFVEVVEA
ncbi:VOC family protein [Halobacterium wangiae]|uniref:VOC family protein n=1 Tax=Halobacterium wangiae TaxID=2902623 RepID=UPI001E4F5F1C|nr:VOC family protein [Halobacterium wangiae]